MADIISIKKHRLYQREKKASVARTLSQARSQRGDEILVIGTNVDGDLYVVGFPNDPGNALWLMELAKRKLLQGD